MFSIKALGGALLEGANGPVRGRASQRRRLALLSVLAVARGRPVAREKLVGLLWPEHPGDAARHLLSESLYVLRKALGDDAFVAVGDEVALDPSVVASDTAAFEAALDADDPARAVEIYHGPFLDGFYLSAADDFGRWVESERDRLSRRYAQALERLAEAEERAGNHLEAVRWWRRLCEWDPYSSRVVLRLMSALESGGEHAAALRVATEHAEFLRDDLGAQPDPAVPAYAERLRTSPSAGRIPVFSTVPLAHPPAERESSRNVYTPGDQVAAAAERFVADTDEDGSPGAVSPTGIPVPRGPRLVVASIALAFVVLAAIAAITAIRGPHRAHSATTALDPRRIAVLYLEDLSERRNQSHLASGLTEALIQQLSQVPALYVVSASGVKRYRNRDVILDSIAADLKVGTLVSGSIQREGGFIRVRVGLIDAATGKQLDSRAVMLPDTNLLMLEDTVAAEVAGFLRRRLGREIQLREWAAGTRDQDALELVLRAEDARRSAADAARGRNPYDVASALRILQHADSLLVAAEHADPEWKQPAVDRGWVSMDRARLVQGGRRISQLQAALRHAARVLARDPRSATALELRGTALWRLSAGLSDSARAAAGVREAERSLRAAVEAAPDLASAWSTLTQLLLFTGAVGEANITAERALSADAYLSDLSEILHAMIYSALMRRSYPDAWQACERGHREFPQDWRFVECRLTLMREDQSRPPNAELAWRLVEELERLDPAEKARTAGNPYSPTYRRLVAAAISARAGDLRRARTEIARARRELAPDSVLQGDMRYDEAYLRHLLGEDRAADSLLRVYVRQHPELRTFILRDPLFRGLSFTEPGTP